MALKYFDVTAPPFNATGNGTTDDASAISAAFDAAKTAGGGTVFFPKGTYNIATKITMNNLDHVETVCGAGAKFTTPATNGVHDLLQMIEFDSSTNCSWRGGWFAGNEVQGDSPDGGVASTHYHAFMKANPDPGHHEVPVFMLIDRCENFVLKDVKVTGAMRGVFFQRSKFCNVDGYDGEGILDGLFSKGQNQNPDQHAESDVVRFNTLLVVSGGCEDITVRNLRANSIDVNDTYCGSAIIVSNVTIDPDTPAQVTLLWPKRVLIDGFHVLQYQDHGVFIEHCESVTVTNGFIRGGPDEATWGAAIDHRAGSHVLISHNQFQQVKLGVALAAAAGEYDSLGAHTADFEVSSNIFEDVSRHAIVVRTSANPELRHCRDVRILNNHVKDRWPDLDPAANYEAIFVSGCDRTLIAGNTVEGWNADRAMHVGRNGHISSSGYNYALMHDVTISDNRVLRSEAGIRVQSVEGAVIRGNIGRQLSGGSPDALLELVDVSAAVVDDNRVEPPTFSVSTAQGSTHASNSIGGNNVLDVNIQATPSTLPDRMADVIGWWRAADRQDLFDDADPKLPVINNGVVARWNSRVGGWALDALTTGNRPILINDDGGLGPNTRALVRFDGSDDYLHEHVATTAIGESSSGGVFVVFCVNSNTNKENGLISAGRASNGRQWSIRVNGSNGVVTLTVQGAVPLTQKTGTISSFATNTPYLLHWRSTGGSGGGWLLEVDGTDIDIGSPSETHWVSDLLNSPPATGASEFVMGAVKLLAPTDYADADIAEVVVYDGTPDVGGIAQYLADSYGISLPSAWEGSLTSFPIPLTQFRVWDAIDTLLPNPSANDDLELNGGTFGNNTPMLKTSDLKAAGATSRFGRVLCQLPPEYEDGGTVKIRVHAGMEISVADNSATVDVELVESDREGGLGSDLVTTSATSMNSLTFADIDFDVNSADLVAGDILDMRIKLAVDDTAGPNPVIGAIGSVELLCSTRSK